MSDEIKPIRSIFLKAKQGGRKRLVEEVFWPDHNIFVDNRIVDMSFEDACVAVIAGVTPDYRNKITIEPKPSTKKEDTSKLYREGIEL